MLVKQSGNIPTLIVFVEYALNNSKVRNIDKGQWFINISTLVEHLNNHLQLSPLDVDLGYDMDLAQFITDIHWTLSHYQDCILNLKIKTEIAIKQLFFDRQTETLHVLLDFVIL